MLDSYDTQTGHPHFAEDTFLQKKGKKNKVHPKSCAKTNNCL